ncbi:hypothetical protein [Cupriavidus sp. YAF13]|uniref:hypothetical protein n=1 Tax=Cupriavidus sp. YAF13 TaxID=3233075 RepID=UPI003F918B58
MENDLPRLSQRKYAACGEESVVFKIEEHRGYTLEHVGAFGKPQTFYPAKSLWLTLEDLQVVPELEPAGGATQSTLATYIHGTARFDDCRVSIMGESESGTRTVQISFAAREIGVADQQGLREWQEALGIAFSNAPLGTARFGYNRPDREMQEPDQWWASCHVPESSLQALCKRFASALRGR